MTKTQLIIAYLRKNPTATSRLVAVGLGLEYNQSFASLVTRARKLIADPEGTREKECERVARWTAANPDYQACYYEANPDKVRKKNARWNAANPDYKREAKARLLASNPDYFCEYNATRRATDPAFKLTMYTRTRIYGALKAAINQPGKSNRSLALLGCSAEEYRVYLEALWAPGMSWENYGEWHIDHTRPLASFDLNDPAQQAVAFHFKNTTPMWAFENLSKGDRWAGHSRAR